MEAVPAAAAAATVLPSGWWWVEPGRILAGRHPARAIQAGLDPWAVLLGLGVSRVLSLVESAEEAEWPPLDPPAGVVFTRFPVPDYGVPDEGLLVVLARSLGQELRVSGTPLFVHCMGGCGRSGVVAAALLLEMGLCPAGELQARLDRRRGEAGLEPGCPETREQREMVSRMEELFGKTR